MSEENCPSCGRLNTDNWPLDIDGEIVDGGCQGCWEAECSRKWWQHINAINQARQGATTEEL